MATLVITPNTDAVERMLGKLATPASANQRPLVRLSAPPSIERTTVDQHLGSLQPPNIAYFGHGRRMQLGKLALIDFNSVPDLQGAVVFALACSASDHLGPISTQRGIKTWVGFTRLVIVPLGTNDPRIAPWKMASFLAFSGTPANVLVQRTQASFETLADEILNSPPTALPLQELVIQSLVQRGLATTFVFDGDPLGAI